LGYLGAGHKRLGVSLATGSGKTVRMLVQAGRTLLTQQVIFTQLIDRIRASNEAATQTLILAHRRELVEQAARHCSSAYPTKSIDIELGSSHASGAADITVASVQSIMSKDRIEKYDPARFKLVLVDEAHHITSAQYLSVLEHFGLRHAQKASPILVGVSATFSRNDGVSLGTAFDYLAFHRDYLDMIESGWLSNVLFTTVRLVKTDLSKVNVLSSGDFATGELSRAVNTPGNNDALFAAWQEKCSQRKSTLVFCVDVQHVQDLARTFREQGYEARFVTGTTPKRKRGETIDQFKKGQFPILLNCGVFTEGTDISNIDCIVLARPTKSRNLLIQMIGRGMRLDSRSGKTDCHILDMVSTLKTGICTTPTLYGLDPDELLDGADSEKLKSLQKKKNSPQKGKVAQNKPEGDLTLKFTDYQSVMDLVEETSGERHIRQLSRNAWIQIDDDEYILTTKADGHLRILKDEDASTFRVTVARRLPPGGRIPFAKVRTIVTGAPSLLAAIHAADSFAGRRFTRALVDLEQPWRERPASDAQIKHLGKFLDPADPRLAPGGLSKGDATDMINKLVFGARGRFRRIERERSLREREELMEQRAAGMGRDSIQVGKLAVD
jgi:ATP-dependent helicase IRC3